MRNIAGDVTEPNTMGQFEDPSELRALFEKYGTIEHIKVRHRSVVTRHIHHQIVFSFLGNLINDSDLPYNIF